MADEMPHRAVLTDKSDRESTLICSAVHFAKGATRWAFKGKFVDGVFEHFKTGDEVVVKVIMKIFYNGYN